MGEHIFFLFVGSQDQESGMHRGQIENVLLPGEPGNPFAQHEIVYLVSRTGTGSLHIIPEQCIQKNKATGILVSSHERRELLKKFSSAMRHARRIYSRSLKNDYLSDRLSLSKDSTAEDVDHLADEDEAFDSYFDTKMAMFDTDFEKKRCNVLSTLRLGEIDPPYSDSLSISDLQQSELRLAVQTRFQSLWSALQRVYFHELEDDQHGNDISLDHAFDAATDPEVSNLMRVVENATLDVEINE
jgi:hypothetical protein